MSTVSLGHRCCNVCRATYGGIAERFTEASHELRSEYVNNGDGLMLSRGQLRGYVSEAVRSNPPTPASDRQRRFGSMAAERRTTRQSRLTESETDFWNQPTWKVDSRYSSKMKTKRRVGIEVETAASSQYKRCRYQRRLEGCTLWGAKFDGSISGIEMVSPATAGDKIIRMVEDLASFARSNDWAVDNNCGLHVHMDNSDLSSHDRLTLFVAYLATCEAWWSFAPSSRFQPNSRGHEYSAKHSKSNWSASLFRHSYDYDDVRSETTDGDRYFWVNPEAYEAHSTFEIRMHPGTTNGRKILNWCKANLWFVDKFKTLGNHSWWCDRLSDDLSRGEAFGLLTKMWDDEELGEFYGMRCRKWHRDSSLLDSVVN